jgi:hypothetical protein
MLLTESQIRKITRKILKELFTKKSGIGLGKLFGKTDTPINPFDYSDTGGSEDAYDDYYGEGEEKLEEEEEEEET